MKHLVALLFSFLIPIAAQGESINYCHDETVNKKWQQLMVENGHHPEWQEMHRLRRQLCNAVDNGQLSVEDASNHFEAERKRVIKEFKQRLENEHGEFKVSA